MGSCELCGEDEQMLIETDIPKSGDETIFGALVCQDCLDEIPETKPEGGYTKAPQMWWETWAKERYREYGGQNRTSMTYRPP